MARNISDSSSLLSLVAAAKSSGLPGAETWTILRGAPTAFFTTPLLKAQWEQLKDLRQRATMDLWRAFLSR